MEQQTVTIKNILRIIYPDIHLRRMTYPPERIRMVEKKETKEEKDINNNIFLRNYETNRI